jgi:hypothetical protein
MKNKVEPEDVNTNQLVPSESIGTELAIPETQQDALSFLSEQPVVVEFGFIKIKPNKGATSFNLDPGGTVDNPLNAVILELDFTRTLWPFGEESVVKTMQEWSRAPICYSRNEWGDNGLRRRGGIIGKLGKEEDSETPEMIKNLIVPIQENRMHCNKCEWAQYGSAFSGAGQACKEQRRLLLYLPDRQSCGVLVVPPASLKNWEKFAILAGGYNRHWSWAVTEFKSIPMKKDNIEYSVLEFDYMKEKKDIVRTVPEMLSSLNNTINYNGIDMIMAKAVVYKFRSLEPEMEYDATLGEAEF